MRGCCGTGMIALPIEHQVEATRKRRRVSQEKSEQLLAALVLVDPPDVDREWLLDVVLLAKSFRRRSAPGSRTQRPPRRREHARCRRRHESSPALPCELYMTARTPRNVGPKIASPIAGSRSAVGTSTAFDVDPPRAVPGVVVAVAEEQDEIELRRPHARGSRRARGWPGPSLSSHASSSAIECGCSNTRRDSRPKCMRIALVARPETAAPARH